MFHISILETLLAMTAFLGPALSFWERCIGERCFTITGPTETRDFEGAKDWCIQKNSSLGVVSDNDTQEALVQYLISGQLNEQPKLQLFIDLKLKQNERTWYIINGSKYLGELQEQNELIYWIYGYLNHYPNRFQVDGSQPTVSRNFICQFDNARCSIKSSNSHQDKDGCFVKYENESLTWFKARERCRNNGGDLAEFNFNSISRPTCCPYDVPFDTSWLNSSFSYWVGIRYRNRYWKSSGSDDEVIFSSWSMDEPNNINNECVCVDPNANPAWWWTDCSCTESRQFICLKIVPTTITSTTTSKSFSTTMSRLASIYLLDVTSTNLQNTGLIVGLVLGIAVILPLLIIIFILVIIIVRLRRSRERSQNNAGAGSLSNTKLTVQGRSDTQLEATVSDAHYQHLQRETMVGPGTSVAPLYDQLNQPQNTDYELTP